MKTKRPQGIIAMIITAYAFSLFPFLTSSANRDFDLRTVIQQMQELNEVSNSDHINFQSTLRDSITSLRAIAGISAVIVEKSDETATNKTSFLIVAVKSPHLLSTAIKPTAFCSESQNSYSREDQSYTSLNCAPEELPPRFLNC